jgi:hypothetical protein
MQDHTLIVQCGGAPVNHITKPQESHGNCIRDVGCRSLCPHRLRDLDKKTVLLQPQPVRLFETPQGLGPYIGAANYLAPVQVDGVGVAHGWTHREGD